MTPEQQRIAIADWCGIKHIQNAYCYGKDGSLPLSDHLNDLNAMHDAEKKLSKKQLSRFAQELRKAVGERYGIIWHATAAQRAEALLKTIGKWTYTKKG